jgi:hypothetical protein
LTLGVNVDTTMPMNLRTFTPALLGLVILVGWVRAADSPELPAPWKHQDIGAVMMPGDASVAGGVFTIKGTLDIWGKADGFHYVWQPLKGDGTIVARVQSITLSGHAKAGLAIRETLAADCRHATIVDTPTDGTQFLVREKAGDVTTAQRTDLHKAVMPYWLKLVRVGDKITGFESVDGTDWKQTGTTNLKLPETVYIGLTTSSHLKDQLCTGTLDHVAVESTSK